MGIMMMPSATPPAKPEKVWAGMTIKAQANRPKMIDGTPVSTPTRKRMKAEKHRPHNSCCHPPTRLSIGGRQLREKGKIQIGQPLAQHIEQQVQQDDHRKPSTGESEHDGKPIGKLPAYAVCRARCLERMRNSTHERLLPARLVPPILAISTRARMLVSKVMTKTRSPASRSAEMKSPGVASPN